MGEGAEDATSYMFWPLEFCGDKKNTNIVPYVTVSIGPPHLNHIGPPLESELATTLTLVYLKQLKAWV